MKTSNHLELDLKIIVVFTVTYLFMSKIKYSSLLVQRFMHTNSGTHLYPESTTLITGIEATGVKLERYMKWSIRAAIKTHPANLAHGLISQSHWNTLILLRI